MKRIQLHQFQKPKFPPGVGRQMGEFACSALRTRAAQSSTTAQFTTLGAVRAGSLKPLIELHTAYRTVQKLFLYSANNCARVLCQCHPMTPPDVCSRPVLRRHSASITAPATSRKRCTEIDFDCRAGCRCYRRDRRRNYSQRRRDFAPLRNSGACEDVASRARTNAIDSRPAGSASRSARADFDSACSTPA
jgi:hypothetical protein